jgi:hypothetical protein
MTFNSLGTRGLYARSLAQENPNKMIKRIAILAILAIQTAAVCSIAKADLPFPTCYPCPGDRKATRVSNFDSAVGSYK